MFLVPTLLFAALGENGISVAPNGTVLKWEEGAWDFFIMHKTLIDHVTGEANKDAYGADTTAQNPQGDTFIESSTYTLTSKHIPPDANVDKAFLSWLSTLDPTNPSAPTDNSVTLSFKNSNDPSITLTKEITASIQGSAAQTTIGNFEFEALAMPNAQNGAEYLYTYRVEVSDFMKEIIAMGEEKGMNSGEALYGEYTVSGMEGSNHQNYLTGSSLVGGWFLPFVYTSSHISAKKIYFYNGFAAYRFQNSTITVSGFELPDEAIIKLGLVVFEGDPGLAMSVNLSLQPATPEGLAISSQGDPTNFAPMFNDCNPPKTITDTYGSISYTEMYNSISSVFGWEDSNKYWCVGNPDQLWPMDTTNPLEYAIDADILMVDASPSGPFYNRFVKGDTSFNLQIGANQDQVYTNILIVSVDTKLPDFDIPNEREKNYCSCSPEPDTFCDDRPFYYTIKVQNHGQNVANNVTLQDELPSQVKYRAGSTEIATKFDANGNGTDWSPVPDVNGDFPYKTAQQVAARLEHCDALPCPENTTVWVRFIVEPKPNLSKNEVIRNSADISSSDSDMVYHSNSNIPLRLTKGNCPPIQECELPPKAQCGGVRVEGNDNYCQEDKDCKDGKKCRNNECVTETVANLTKNAKVSFGIGDNDTNKGNKDSSSETIIPNPSDGLVLGQFYLLNEDGNKDQSYEFNTARLQFSKDADIEAKNFKLYKDENGDGKVNEGDKEIASSASLESSQDIKFSIINAEDRLTKAGIKNHFIVVADVSSTNTTGKPGKFNLAIQGPESFAITDSGNVEVTGDAVKFTTFRFEPSEGFVFTKGTVTPSVPAFNKFNGEHEILQIRTKSIGVADKIKSIKIRTAGSNYVKFNKGIKSVSLYEDVNGNGIVDAGENLIKKISSFDGEASSVVFDGLDGILTYAAGDQKYLIVKVELKMSLNEKVKIQVPESGVKTATSDPVGLPVSSIEFVYECDKNNPNSCNTGSEDEGGCAISAIPENDNSSLYLVFAAFAALLALAGVKLFASKK